MKLVQANPLFGINGVRTNWLLAVAMTTVVRGDRLLSGI